MIRQDFIFLRGCLIIGGHRGCKERVFREKSNKNHDSVWQRAKTSSAFRPSLEILLHSGYRDYQAIDL